MDEIREQGLLASFEILVDYCMVKAWADDGNHIGNLLEEEEEEAARKQTELLASTSKAPKSKSSASRRKQNAGKKEESDLNAQHPEDEEINTLNDEEEHDSSSRPNQRNSKEIEDYTEQDSCNVAATRSSALPSIDDSVHDTTFPSLHREMASESMKPCDVIDDGINDAGPLSSRQSIASTRKARKHSYAQRNERMQDQSKQSKKHTQNNSSKDEKELDRLSQLKKSDSEHPADKAPEFNNQEQASSDAAATLSDLVQRVGNFEQGDNMSSALNHKKVTESTVKRMEWVDLADDIYDLLSRDDGCSISKILLPENSGRGEWGGTLDNMADQAPEVDQQEHASSDAAATRSDLVQSVGNFVQGGGTSSALNHKKVTESTIKEIEWTDLPDDMNDLPPLPPRDGGGSLSKIPLPENSEEGRGELGGTSNDTADQAPASSDAAAIQSALVQSVGDVVQEEHDFSSQWSQNDFEESEEIIIDEFLSWLIRKDSVESEENVIDKPSEQLEEQGSTKDAAAQTDLVPTGDQSVVERLFAAQTLEAAAEILKEVVWGDLTNEDIELYSKPPALDSAPAVDDGGSLSMQPERSAEETEGGQWAGETPEKSEGGEGEGEDTNGSGGGQGERENTEAGCGSRSQQQYGENMRAERGSGQQIHTQAGHSRSHTIHYPYGGVTILRRTSEAPGDIESPAAQRDPLPSKNKGPAEHEDSLSAPICVPRESADSTAVSAKSVAEEGEEKETPGETRAGPRQQQCLTQFLLQRRCYLCDNEANTRGPSKNFSC